MAQLQKIITPLSVEEYLEGEQYAEVRHEFIDGVVYAMSGGTRNHNRIALNISYALEEGLENGPCKHFINDIKLRVQTLESESFYYPDVVVTCDPEDNNELYVEKPTTIIEVLSDSTERIDKQEKFFAYRTLESLEEYILISQKTKEVTVSRKANQWKKEVISGDDFELSLSCTGNPLTSARIYKNVDFDNLV